MQKANGKVTQTTRKPAARSTAARSNTVRSNTVSAVASRPAKSGSNGMAHAAGRTPADRQNGTQNGAAGKGAAVRGVVVKNGVAKGGLTKNGIARSTAINNSPPAPVVAQPHLAPKPVPARPPVDPRYASFLDVLMDKRRELLGSLEETKFDTLARLGRVAEEDQAQLSHEEFISLQRNSMDYQALRLVDGALDRMRSGEYGTCQECEEEISAKRLAAIPWAKYCVHCQDGAHQIELNEQYDHADAW
ncbi:MAG: TraR/DksA family transcriptional regulator [Bryobacteraceae bacterium]